MTEGPAPASSPRSDSNPGRLVAMALVIVAVIVVAWFAKQRYLKPPNELSARQSLFIDSETGKSFNYELKEGDTIPVRSPDTGKQTGYPAELCYWTKEGTVKETPTPVLMNESVGKPPPTFCPDCGRLVVGHNPRPQAGDAPPPTKEEYAASATTAPTTRAQDRR